MQLDDFDKQELADIGAIVGLEKADSEDWFRFAIRLLMAYDQPLLKAKHATTIDRLVGLAQRLRRPETPPA
jgi:hypothetical protein